MREKIPPIDTDQNFWENYCSLHHFTNVQEITRGWSADKKYLAQNSDGEKFLLRTTVSAKKLPYKQQEFAALKTLEKLNLRVPKAIDLTYCNDSETICMLLSWVPGRELEDVLPELSPKEQYRLGVCTGKILQKLHSLPAPKDLPGWDKRYGTKIDRKLREYADCGIQLPNDDIILRYIAANRHLIQNRPQCFQHGDYHVGNMVLDEAGNPGIIDFDRMDYGDPWEEFNRITWCKEAGTHFASGRITGYFGGEVPENFWKLFLLYISVNMIGSIPWAVPFGEEEVAIMMQTAQNVLSWFDDLNTPVPNWYCSPFDNMRDSQKR